MAEVIDHFLRCGADVKCVTTSGIVLLQEVVLVYYTNTIAD